MSPRVALPPMLAAAAAVALGACSQARPPTAESPPPMACATCHGTAGRTGNLPGTDPLLEAAPPIAPAGAPSYAVGAHQAHLNPTGATAFLAPIACNECHVVPRDTSHAANPPANKVVFGTKATLQGQSPVWNAGTAGCSATYCHGSFTFNGVTGTAAAPLWTDTGIGCTSCHAMPPAGHPVLTGTVTPATCATCHPRTVLADGTIDLASGAHINGQADVSVNCTSCHGTAGRTGNLPGTDLNLPASPPVAPVGAPSYAVGAHQAHLNPPASGALRNPIACAECHVVPTDAAHADNPPASPVVFGTLARTQGNAPAWTPTTTGCSATYCHGSFTFNGVTGAAATPSWTGAGLTCVSCHGMPPTGHPTLPGTVTAATCATCHPSTVLPDGSIDLASGAHIDGQSQVVMNCTSCHGTAGRTGNLPGTDPNLAAAPPVAPNGAPSFAVGAHQAHLNPPSNGALRRPLACNECHVVPTDGAHAVSPPANRVVFGTLASTQGNNPSWSPTTTGCSATYCHGSFNFNGVTGAAGAPTWTTTGITCVNCHGLPPTGHPALAGTVTPATCSGCHPATVNSDGTINVSATGAHVNGRADVATSCTSCHGTATRPATQTNPMLMAAPPVAAPGTSPRTVGTHLAHLQDGTIRQGVACGNCHVVPGNPDHSITHPPVITWSTGTLATTQSARPTYDGTAFTCSATYCHGNFTFNGVTGNTGPTPAWDAAGTPACTLCHGMPPTGHPALGGTVTAATCNGCHNQTVNADGTINVAGGKHMNGAADVTGGHPAGWSDPTVHGYAANRQGLQTCTTCHVNLGPANGVAGSGCADCHGAGWTTNCTFCHGTAGRTFLQAGPFTHPAPTTSLLAAAPPIGPLGETGVTGPTGPTPVGAHQRHVNPPATGARSTPFECGNCHGSNLPVDVTHVNGQLPTVPFGLIAITGGASPVLNFTNLTCSATYCHGNFSGGVGAGNSVSWGATNLACNSCHGIPPLTGHHDKHVNGESISCATCHGTGYGASSITGGALPLHVDGVKTIASGSVPGWNPTTRQCTGCHPASYGSW